MLAINRCSLGNGIRWMEGGIEMGGMGEGGGGWSNGLLISRR